MRRTSWKNWILLKFRTDPRTTRTILCRPGQMQTPSDQDKYAEFDLNDQGEIDMMGLKRMMEKLGVPKTHLEMKKMISEVTEGISDSINYRDFVKMMLGKRSAVLKLVMIFEDKANGAICKPDGPPPKRDIASLP
ncbi:allograft inflammatory factor 1-like isoform X3 [Oncorhynchus mykiss]|uniref:allograft inflammatory factor 1-like isoform X3 n=1 Tax=Oncorhynchus mykiss TaxID=8022 RepID=UPI0018776933|nr:allograft inflammatory factor 1-like isoform X3 [Oncorhynchus mykiss]